MLCRGQQENAFSTEQGVISVCVCAHVLQPQVLQSRAFARSTSSVHAPCHLIVLRRWRLNSSPVSCYRLPKMTLRSSPSTASTASVPSGAIAISMSPKRLLSPVSTYFSQFTMEVMDICFMLLWITPLMRPLYLSAKIIATSCDARW